MNIKSFKFSLNYLKSPLSLEAQSVMIVVPGRNRRPSVEGRSFEKAQIVILVLKAFFVILGDAKKLKLYFQFRLFRKQKKDFYQK